MAKAEAVRAGTVVWIPCEVRSGPFPNERRVYVKTGMSEWFGFVRTSELKDKVSEGEDRVQAVVLAVEPDRVVVGVRGQSPASGMIQARPSQIAEYGSLSA